MKKTPLVEIHSNLGAKMAGFAGWEMPIQYDGIVAEHNAVRSSVGVFDISHMGQFVAKGEGVGAWLNSLLTNDTSKLEDRQGQYTLMLNDAGGVIDDMIIYRESETSYFLVVNASMIAEDFSWLKNHLAEGISLEDESEEYAGVAVQGPGAVAVWNALETGIELPGRNGIARSNNLIVCRTGYTGEDGFEFFASPDDMVGFFQQMIDAGAKPCGLGARDTLRLEKGYPLNGNDLDPIHTPLEAGLGYFTKLKTDIDFIGRSKLEQQKAEGLKQRLVAIQMVGKAPPPRHGYTVIDPGSDQKIGELSSGSLSPTLGKGIAMAYLPVSHSKVGTSVEIEIRQKRFSAEVVKKPFV